MRVARWILGIAVTVVLLAVAAALLATLVIDPDRYRGDIERAVTRETGRPFLIEGHLRLTWFPWLGVRMGAARLGNPAGAAGAAGPDLLDWQSAQAHVRLMPLLLHRQLEVGRIVIEGADIHLRRGPDGRGNWEDLIARANSGGRTEAPPTAGAAGEPAPAARLTAWGGLDLEKSALEYVDERSREHASLTDWQLHMGEWRPGQPLSLSTAFLLHADTLGAPPSSAAGALRLPAAGVRVSLDLQRLRLHTTPLGISAPRWAVEVADAKLNGALEASRDAAGRLTASGSLTAAVSSLRALARSLGIGMPSIEDPTALGALSLSGSWSYRDGALAIQPLAARVDATSLSGWIARSANPSSAWRFALHADEIDFDRYVTHPKERRPLELPVSALRALRAQGTLALDRARIGGTTLEDLRLQVQ